MTPTFHAYAMTQNPPALVPASPYRKWMDEFPDKHAYRCLPLSIANAHGWFVLSPCTFEVHWTGGPEAKDITFKALDGFPNLNHLVVSNFTHGIVTFHTGYMFQTSAGWNTFASGPTNHVKDGIVPLSGIMESHWLPYPFTMNWHFTRPGVVRWEKDEPYCMVFPIPHAALDDIVPEIHELESNPELKEQYAAWLNKRNEFMTKFRAGDEATLKQAWQRYYFLGKMASDGTEIETHVNKLRLSPPRDTRPSRVPIAPMYDPLCVKPTPFLTMADDGLSNNSSR